MHFERRCGSKVFQYIQLISPFFQYYKACLLRINLEPYTTFGLINGFVALEFGTRAAAGFGTTTSVGFGELTGRGSGGNRLGFGSSGGTFSFTGTYTGVGLGELAGLGFGEYTLGFGMIFG
jgi:hypothetical protein